MFERKNIPRYIEYIVCDYT